MVLQLALNTVMNEIFDSLDNSQPQVTEVFL